MRMFGAPATPAALPTAAERIRSILEAAHSMTAVTEDRRTEVRHLDGADPMGRLHLHPAEPGGESECGRDPAGVHRRGPHPGTGPRARPRHRPGPLLTPFSDLSADSGSGAGSTCMEFVRAELETPDGVFPVGLEELDAARPDPLAPYEAGMLTHLLDDHHELVTLLLRLVQPAPTAAVLRALPLALDRYGITLRLEERSGHRDVRLPFPSPLDDVEQSGAQIQALFSAARRRSHRNTLPA